MEMHEPANENECLCVFAGLLRCGQTGLQWGRWQALCKSAQSFHLNFCLIKSEVWSLWHAASEELYRISPALLISIHSDCISRLGRKESSFWCHWKCIQDFIIYLQSSAALRSLHEGECEYEPAARWDEVILDVFIKVICSCKSSADATPPYVSCFMFEHN